MIGFYGGTLQAGVGFFISLILLMLIPRIPMAEVHGIKTLVVTIYVSISLLVFIFNDMIDWKFAIALSIGSAIGGSFGGKYASIMPDRLLQRILIGAIIFFALILILK
ncbi:TSUP family transporter [Salinicoccus sp. CNSTN-B1]